MPEIGDRPGGNQPWGGIFKVETPALDRIQLQLEQNANERKSFVQKQALQTDELLNKEMANVRSIDTDEVSKAYNDWKMASQPLYFNKRLQANPKEFNKAQMQANAALGALRAKINQSSQLNQFGKTLAANRLAKPDAYDDEAGNMLSTFYGTPMSKINAANVNGTPVDLTNVDAYRYKPGNADLSKLHQAAIGKPVTHYDDGTTDASGIQTTQHGIQYGNTPLQYRDAYLPGLAGSQANRRARYEWSQHSANQQDIDELDAAYQSSPNWKKLGLAPQQLPAYNPNDPVGNEATYQAKKYLVSMNPAEVKASVVTNKGAQMDKAQQQKIQMEGIKHANRSAEIMERFGNSKGLIDYKKKVNNPEEGIPTVDDIQTAVEDPGKIVNGQTLVQHGQKVLSVWNSQGNTANTQTKLTMAPAFTNENVSKVKGFDDLVDNGIKTAEAAYAAIEKPEVPLADIKKVLNRNANPTVQQRAETLAKMYNTINEKNGSPVRFSPEDLKKSVPVIYERNDVFSTGNKKTYNVVKAGSPEFNNVINEKRNAFLSSKKPVIQGGEGKPGTTTEEVKIQKLAEKYNF